MPFESMHWFESVQSNGPKTASSAPTKFRTLGSAAGPPSFASSAQVSQLARWPVPEQPTQPGFTGVQFWERTRRPERFP